MESWMDDDRAMESWSEEDRERVRRIRKMRRTSRVTRLATSSIALGTGIWIGLASGPFFGVLAMVAASNLIKTVGMALSTPRSFGADGDAGSAGRPVRPTSTPPLLIASAARPWPPR